MRVLVLNAGSSSLKASVIEDAATAEPVTVARESIAWGSDASRTQGREPDVRRLIERFDRAGIDEAGIDAVGHRIVHGGERFRASIVIDDELAASIALVSDLAPLHNTVALETLRAARSSLGGVPHVAAFDTAFHASLPEMFRRYPLPEHWYRDWGVRRYGFHGLSVAWSVRRASGLLGRSPAKLSLVVAHLGSGCSVTAVDAGRSVWNSMGMTPLDGLMMGTRAGSIDPGILIQLLREGRLDVDGLADVLDHGSGLAAVAGGFPDMRDLVRRADEGDEPARLAIGMFVARAAQGIAAAATVLPRLDALVFTGGIGEHATAVRSAIAERLAVLGVPGIPTAGIVADTVDAVLVAAIGTGPSVLCIEAREDLVIAGEVESLLAGVA